MRCAPFGHLSMYDSVIRGIFALAPPMPFLFGRFLFPAGDFLVRYFQNIPVIAVHNLRLAVRRKALQVAGIVGMYVAVNHVFRVVFVHEVDK